MAWLLKNTTNKMEEKKIEAESFFKWMHNRVMKQQKNAIIATIGPTGSGKSFIDLRIAEKITRINLNKEFDPKNITFTAKQCMERINSGELERGDVLILEEMGVAASSREWWSIQNKMLSYLTQTFREKGYIFLMNTPNISFIDTNIRKLIHCTLTAKKIDFASSTVRVVPKILQVNYESGKIYSKFLRVRIRNKMQRLKSVTLNRPSKELEDNYLKLKHKFLDKLNADIERKIMAAEVKDEVKENKILRKKELTELQSKIVECWKQGMKVQKEIAEKLGKGSSQISENYKFMANKGYFPKDFE